MVSASSKVDRFPLSILAVPPPLHCFRRFFSLHSRPWFSREVFISRSMELCLVVSWSHHRCHGRMGEDILSSTTFIFGSVEIEGEVSICPPENPFHVDHHRSPY
ncbi:hypothetical protein V6N13_060183 [Hibiscus sabdariffa]|uniref:Uncharacterized protein n=1 Tax=Hibiscus sabdariffa TaxID=183260 RepID=A0ABR2GAZ7_9ROSI